MIVDLPADLREVGERPEGVVPQFVRNFVHGVTYVLAGRECIGIIPDRDLLRSRRVEVTIDWNAWRKHKLEGA